MRIWLRQHGFALKAALGNLGKAPASFFFNVVVVAIALALPFAGLTLLENVRPLSEQLAVEPEISVFLAQQTSRDDAVALAPRIRRALGDERKALKVVFVPREKALESFKSTSGLTDVLATLGDNPLPDSYVIKLGALASAAQAEQVESMAAQLRALPGVESVQVDSAWVKRLAALLGVLRLALLILAATLGVVVVAVVFNTVRLQVMTQIDEIEVSRLIGATDAFIHRPFYYTGALLGLLAGALALGAVALSLHPINGAIAEFARLYGSQFQLAPLSPLATSLMLGLAALLGLVGALLSVRRHLARLT
ncbi:MAG TPA: permease-like cell division protein FtsX [Burkholderiaceae bacterium]